MFVGVLRGFLSAHCLHKCIYGRFCGPGVMIRFDPDSTRISCRVNGAYVVLFFLSPGEGVSSTTVFPMESIPKSFMNQVIEFATQFTNLQVRSH